MTAMIKVACLVCMMAVSKDAKRVERLVCF